MGEYFKKVWLTGYIILPCFTVRTLENGESAEMTCNKFLFTIFNWFFAPFWNGAITVTGKVEE